MEQATQRESHPINSRQWWEDYFRSQWSANGGSEQTRHFMRRLVESLGRPEAAYLESRSCEVLDWGCAFGEGVEVLAGRFPRARVTGLDFAAQAIEEARRRHPGHDFVLTEEGRIPRAFDVIVTSNCLEHFERPLEVVADHLRFCRKFYVVLVPNDEQPLCQYHRSRLRADSFPERIGEFVRLAAMPIDVDRAHWTGQQLLVVYGSGEYVAERAATTDEAAGALAVGSDAEREKWERLYAELPLHEEDEATGGFNREFAEWVSALLPDGGTTLEAGCGAGWQSLALAKTGKFRATLMDFTAGALDYARRLFEREGARAEFVREDVFTHGRPEFDLVFNAGVLEHYTPEQQAAFLRAMGSRSRRYVMALVPNRSCYWYWVWRVRQAGAGQWPYGKEVPRSDLSAAFEAAGLTFVGQRFGGAAWTEAFVRATLAGDPAAAEQVLRVHRSPLIADVNRGYLLAALGTVSAAPVNVPVDWRAAAGVEDTSQADVQAALGDALALRLASEGDLKALRERLAGTEKEVAGLRAKLEAAEAEARRVGDDLVWYDATNRQLEKRLEEGADAARRAAALEVEALRLELTARETDVRGLRPKLAAREAEMQDLRGQLAALNKQWQGEERRRAGLRATLAREQQARRLLEKGVTAGYQNLVAKVGEVVGAVAPRGATVLVISKGDESLLRLEGGRRGWHFPRTERGEYAGHYPRDGAEAIEHLESSRAQGAGFLVIPNTAFWWLDHYQEFSEHLESHYRRAWDDGHFIVYDVTGMRGGLGRVDVRRRGKGILRRLAGLVRRGPSSNGRREEKSGNGRPAAVVRRSVARESSERLNGSGESPASAVPATRLEEATEELRGTAMTPEAGHAVILAAVPYDDIGGGQRAAQLTRALLRRHWRVTYVYVYPRTDMTTGSRLESNVRRPRLTHVTVDEITPAELLSGAVEKTTFVFEVPHRRFLPFAELAWKRGLHTIFELIDDWESSLGAGWFDAGVMREFVRRCSRCFGSARVLVEKLRAMGATNPEYLPNAADESVFDAYKSYYRPADYPSGYRKTLLYFGSMYGDWFGWEYVKAAAERNSADGYVMIGAPPRSHGMPSNVIFLGPKQNMELPAYLWHADAAIIPFLPGAVTDAVSPVKAFEYLFLKKAVIATRMPELDGYPNVYQGGTPEQFARLCGDVATAAAAADDEFDLFVSRNSWNARIDRLMPRRRAGKRFSFVTLVHNNRAIIGRHLRTLSEHTAGLDAEIIVVDNASTDGTAEFVAGEFGHVKLLHNPVNGCSSGRNLGASVATGGYLVFLDSDQWFTSGAWLHEADHILRHHPMLGAVGWAGGWFSRGLDSLGGPTTDDLPGRGHNMEIDRRGFRTDITYLGTGGMVIPREVWAACDGFDTFYDPHIFEDTDLSFQIRKAGFVLAYRDLTGIRHQPHQTTRANHASQDYQRLFIRNSSYFKNKWADYLELFSDGQSKGERRPFVAQTAVSADRGLAL